jgi:hypothetical protein
MMTALKRFLAGQPLATAAHLISASPNTLRWQFFLPMRYLQW